MRIFILEDDPVRQLAFRRALSGNMVFAAANYEDAIDTLANEDAFDVFYFDHDLGHPILDGDEVAKFVVGSLPKEKWPKRVVVHSWNPSGAEDIVSTFSKAGIKVVAERFRG